MKKKNKKKSTHPTHSNTTIQNQTRKTSQQTKQEKKKTEKTKEKKKKKDKGTIGKEVSMHPLDTGKDGKRETSIARRVNHNQAITSIVRSKLLRGRREEREGGQRVGRAQENPMAACFPMKRGGSGQSPQEKKRLVSLPWRSRMLRSACPRRGRGKREE